MQPARERARERRRRRLRRAGALLGTTLIAAAVWMILGLQVSSNGKQEWIAGHADTSSLLLPLALFALGGLLLALCLPA